MEALKTLFCITLLIVFTITGCNSSTTTSSISSSNASQNIQKVQPTESTSAASDKQAEQAMNTNKAKSIKEKLLNSYGGAGNPQYAASWYRLIEDVEVYGNTAYVKTSIYRDTDGKKKAQQIANVVYSLRVEGITHVEVDGSDRGPLAINNVNY